MRSLLLAVVASMVLVALAEAQVSGPDPYSARRMLGAESYTWSSVRQPAAQSATPRRTAARGGGYSSGRANSGTKPFNTIVHEPTISPYLNLYREEEEDAAPNYFAFVRPQQQQHESNRRQVQELQRLQQRVNQASYYNPAAGAGTVTGAARFGDTAHFYGGFRR